MIEKYIVFVGCCDYAEIWSEQVYEEMKAQEDLTEILAELEALGR